MRKTHSNIRLVPFELRLRPVMAQFRVGFDTADIAFSRGVTEAHIYNHLAADREREYQRKLSALAPSLSPQLEELSG
jgi:hypothetical protein